MRTDLSSSLLESAAGREADAILRSCVHCGFCNAVCPTYQLLGDELDGPRGRIYLIKQTLEGHAPGPDTQLHLDRCLTCLACEPACPSGVRYGKLLDIGRAAVEAQVPRRPVDALLRRLLRLTLPHRAVADILLALGRAARPLLPDALRRKLTPAAPAHAWPAGIRAHARRMLVLEGCVQPGLSPATNAAAARVLDRLGISLLRAPRAGCCGALSYHLAAQDEGLDYMRRNIDAWWPEIEGGAEAIVITASGCGALVAEYGELLAHDPAYSHKAERVSALAHDIGDIIAAEKERLLPLLKPAGDVKLAFHAPCTLQNALRRKSRIETLLTDLGYTLTAVPDAHLCCGSAGTYSVLQPELSARLLANKISALTSGAPAQIVTANIGCQTHLQSATALPVRHWIEALDARLL